MMKITSLVMMSRGMLGPLILSLNLGHVFMPEQAKPIVTPAGWILSSFPRFFLTSWRIQIFSLSKFSVGSLA